MTPISGDRKRRICYFFDSDIGNYHYGPGHPMKPHRIRMTHALVMNYGLYKKMEIFRAKPATRKEMAQFHTDDYVEFLSRVTPDNMEGFLKEQAKFNLGDDCPVFDGLFEYCSISAGGSMEGAARLSRDKCDIAVNWAGGLHHAKKAEANGFCYVNDIVLGILELLRYHKRVLYVDIDVHHGDGVEEAFYTTDRVMTCSFHKYGEFFPGTGELRDIGSGKGKRYAVNFPLRDGITDEAYKNIFEPVIMKIMETYQPSAIVLQCGGDSLAGDRLGSFNVSLKGHANCVQFIKSLGLPLLLLGGGGYTIRNVSRTWAFETGLAAGQELCREIPMNEYYEYFGPTYHLDVPASNMEDMNVDRYLEKVKVQIFENLRHTIPVPSVEMQPIPRLPHDDMEVDEDLDDPNERRPQRLLDALVQRDDEYSDSEDEGEGGRRDVQSNKRPRTMGRNFMEGDRQMTSSAIHPFDPNERVLFDSSRLEATRRRPLLDVDSPSGSGSSPLSESVPPTTNRGEAVLQAEKEADLMELDRMATALVEDVNRHTSQLHQQQEAASTAGGPVANQQAHEPPKTSSVDKTDEKMQTDEVEPSSQLIKEQNTPSNLPKPESNDQPDSRPSKISVSVAPEIEMTEGEPSTSTTQIQSSTSSITIPSEKPSQPSHQTFSNVIMSDSDVTALQQILDSAGSDMSFDTSLPVGLAEMPVQVTLPPVQAALPAIQALPPVSTTLPAVQAARTPVQAAHAPVQAAQTSVQAPLPPVQATLPPVQAALPPVQAAHAPVQATQTPLQATNPPVQVDSSVQARPAVQAQPVVQAARAIAHEAPVDVGQTASTKIPEVQNPNQEQAKTQQASDTIGTLKSPKPRTTPVENAKQTQQIETRVPAPMALESPMPFNQPTDLPKPLPIADVSHAGEVSQPKIAQPLTDPKLHVLPESQTLPTTIEPSIAPKVIQPSITAEVIHPPPTTNSQESKALPTSLPASNVITSNLTQAPVIVTQSSNVDSPQPIAFIQPPVGSDQRLDPQPAPTAIGTVSSLTTHLPTTPSPSVIQSSSNPVIANPTTSQPITIDKLATDWKDSINPSLVSVNSPAPMNEPTKVEPEPIIVTPQVISNETQVAPQGPQRALSVMEEMELVIEQQRKTQTDSIPTNLITATPTTSTITLQEASGTITPKVIAGTGKSTHNLQLDGVVGSSTSTIPNARTDEPKTPNLPLIEMDPQLDSQLKASTDPVQSSRVIAQPTENFTIPQTSSMNVELNPPIGQLSNSLQSGERVDGESVDCEAIDPAIQGSLGKNSGVDQ